MESDNNIEQLFNNSTIDENKDNINNFLKNNDISKLNLLDRKEKKYNINVGEILKNPKPHKRKFYYPKDDEYDENEKIKKWMGKGKKGWLK